MATPILPQRRNFKDKFGCVEYQRTNFPLTLSYAITAHKSQGETLDEVKIDFAADKERNIKNYIIPGSFYVTLTRVNLGSKVYLRSFDKSFIKVNKSIEEMVDATMRKSDAYTFKKIFLDEQLYEDQEKEIKLGYLNINVVTDGGHGEYFNSELNLHHPNILVLADNKLDKSYSDEKLSHLINE